MLDRVVHLVQVITAVLIAAFVILLFVNEPAQPAPVPAVGSQNEGATLYSTSAGPKLPPPPSPWQDAASFATFELALTAAELRELTAAVDDLLRPYRVGARTDAPDEAGAVHVVVQAFPRVDAG